MAYFQPDYFPGFIAPPPSYVPPPHTYVRPPPPSPGTKTPATPPPAPHAAAPPPSHTFPPPPPHIFPPTPHHNFPPPPPHHNFPPPPPHVYPQPPPLHPNIPPPAPEHHSTVIIVVFVSLGGLFFLAFLSLALCCFIKKRKKVEKSETINVEEHFKVQEAIVPGPHGQETVVLSMEEVIKFEDKIKEDEKLNETDEGAIVIHGEPSHSHSSDLLHIKHKA